MVDRPVESGIVTTFDEALTREADVLLTPSYAARLAQSFFTHSAHAPLAILILELLLAPAGYLGKPDPYILLLAALSQAAWLARGQAPTAVWIILGNLVGPAVYALAEGLLEGMTFFSQAQHLAYLVIGFAFAAVQGAKRAMPALSEPLLLIENIVRAAIPLLLYAVFEVRLGRAWGAFFGDLAHLYLTIIVLLLGVLLGFADISLRRTQETLRNLASQLHRLSSWGFGAHVVTNALTDAGRLAPQRQERAMLFMDIRDFTRWSDPQPPEAVVDMLDAYYARAEHCLLPHQPIKIKFAADEVMAVFVDRRAALAAARALQAAIVATLAPYGLTVGIGLHAGPVVEGLLGSKSTKAFDVIGDAVNTAARLCAAAGPGELLVSEDLLRGLDEAGGRHRAIKAKGKSESLNIRVLEIGHASAAG